MFRGITPSEAGTEHGRGKVLSRLLAEPREPNGNTVRYSDLGYITAGECFTSASGLSLGALVERVALAPLRDMYGPLSIAYRPVLAGTAQISARSLAPTERCAWRNTVVRGAVHDENAYALGGECGHAGLFGTARDLAILGEASLRALERDPALAHWISRDVLCAMTALRDGGAQRLGFDGKSPAPPAQERSRARAPSATWASPAPCSGVIPSRASPSRS